MSDYIDRQAAIRWIKTECNPYGKPTIDYESGVKVIDHIETMPPAEVEPVKRGKWIYDNQFHWYRASCSECGYKRVTDIKAEKWNDWHYCPNCGAKMEPISASPENGQEVEE